MQAGKPTDSDAMITVPAQGETNGHQWVDLGLPSGTKWATCNIGAQTSEEYGQTFLWANITPKIPDVSQQSKAYGKSMSAIGGSKTYDAAAALWGGSWKMPTNADMEELMKHCTWEYTTLGRVTGCKVTSKINGNYIFFPMVGAKDSKNAAYWTCNLLNGDSTGNADAYALSMTKEMIVVTTKARRADFPIRPVTK